MENEMSGFGINQMPVQPEEVLDVALASPWKRIGAYLLNVFFAFLAYLPLVGAAIWPMRHYASRAEGMDAEALAASDWSMPWLLGGGLVFLIYMVLQAWMMSSKGQSFGKKVMGIRVLRTDGSNPGFWGTVMMREVVYNLLLGMGAMIIGYLVALLGGGVVPDKVESIANLVSLAVTVACVVMMFNAAKDRRTVQDYLANTVVVALPKSR